MDSKHADVVPYRFIANDIAAVDISAVDSSERSAVDAADETHADLLGSRDHYRRIVQALSEGVFVQDRLGKMLTVNSAAAKILGLDVKHLAGRSTAGLAWDIVDEHGVAVAVDDRPGRRCITSGKPTVGEVFGMRGAGWTAEMDRDRCPPAIRTATTGRYAVVSTVRDVTDKLSAQRAAATAEHRHQLVLANAGRGLPHRRPGWHGARGEPTDDRRIRARRRQRPDDVRPARRDRPPDHERGVGERPRPTPARRSTPMSGCAPSPARTSGSSSA